MVSLENILAYIKLPARYLFGISSLGIILLFAPDSFLDKMSVVNIRNEYKSIIGIATLACSVFFIIQIIMKVIKQIKYIQFKNTILDSLERLSPEEKGLLYYCIENNQQTIVTMFDDMAARSLVHKNIVIMDSGTNNIQKWPFSVSPVVWKYLKRNTHLLNNYTPYQPHRSVLW